MEKDEYRVISKQVMMKMLTGLGLGDSLAEILIEERSKSLLPLIQDTWNAGCNAGNGLGGWSQEPEEYIKNLKIE